MKETAIAVNVSAEFFTNKIELVLSILPFIGM